MAIIHYHYPLSIIIIIIIIIIILSFIIIMSELGISESRNEPDSTKYRTGMRHIYEITRGQNVKISQLSVLSNAPPNQVAQSQIHFVGRAGSTLLPFCLVFGRRLKKPRFRDFCSFSNAQSPFSISASRSSSHPCSEGCSWVGCG